MSIKAIRTFAFATAVAFGAFGAFASTASAGVETCAGYTYTPDAAPLNLEVRYFGIDGTGNCVTGGVANNISPGDVLAGNLTNGTDTNGGMISFLFTATTALNAVNISTSNPLSPFLNLVLSWCPEGTYVTQSTSTCFGTTESSITEPIESQLLSTTFAAGESKWLLATWSGVTTTAADLDFRIDVSPVPIPAPFLLLGAALAGLVGFSRIRRKKKSVAATSVAAA